jgi:transcriptional regulator with XRE-family HTH domain
MADVMASEPVFQHLPPEPFGAQMRRARELAGLTIDQAATEVSRYWATSTATISRIENSRDAAAPADPGRRIIAGIAAVIYRVMPSDLGIDLGDVPPNILALLRSATPSAGGGSVSGESWSACTTRLPEVQEELPFGETIEVPAVEEPDRTVVPFRRAS